MDKYQVQNYVGWQQVEDELVVVSLKGGAHYNFTGTSKKIWELICQHFSIEQIADEFVSIYKIDRRSAHADIENFVNELLLEELIIKL